MSVEYDLYLEGLIEGEWAALGPWFKGRDSSFHLGPVMSGQSSVRMMLQDLPCIWGAPSDISPDVREKLVCAGCTVSGNTTTDLCFEQAQWFSLSALDKIDPARFEHEAYVPRDLVHAFERGDCDEICDWLAPGEYGSLPADEKEAYTYYRWTEPWGAYALKVELKQHCEAITDMFRDCWTGDYCANTAEALRCVVSIR